MSFLLASTSHYVGIVLDIAFVVVLLTFAIIGYHYGLLKSIIALFSTAVVLFLAIYFANGFAKLINSIYDFTALIATKLAPSIKKIDPVFLIDFPAGMSGSQFYTSYISTSGANSVLKKFFKYALKGYSASEIEGLAVADVLAGATASIIMTIISGILLFILIKIALSFLSRFFDNITRTRVLGGLNKILGFIFGAVKGGAILLMFIIITIFVTFVPKANKKIYPLIQNDTKVVKIAYNLTDKYIEKSFIKSDVITKWINNLWDNRELAKDKEQQTEANISPILTLTIGGEINIDLN